MPEEDKTNPTTELPETNPAKDGTSDTPEPAKMLTQDEVNKLVGQARKDGKRVALTDFLAELGFDDPKALKSLVDEAKAAREAELSEAQKAQKALEAANAKLAARERELETERQARLVDKRNAALRDAAGEADTPEDVILWATAHAAELVDAILTDEGTIDEKAVTAVIEAAKKARPKWFQHTSTPGSPSVAGGRVPSPGKDRVEKALAKGPKIRL